MSSPVIGEILRMEPIKSIISTEQTSALPSLLLKNTSASSGADFGQIFANAIDQLTQKEQAADQTAIQLASGKDVELHQVMLAMQEADLTFQLALQVRNKLVEAYQEIMRMQV
jgi:flagellar hook-basal body complex protein FliE